MIEATMVCACVIGTIMALIPISRVIDGFPHVEWDMVLADAIAALAYTALGAIVAMASYAVANWLIVEPLTKLLAALS